jgi:hypothetical protein
MSAYLQTGEGQQFSKTYGQYKAAYSVGFGVNSDTPAQEITDRNTAFDTLVNSYNAWNAGNAQTGTNWKNYSRAASANQGGQGDQTITQGAAVSQSNQLLGSLSQQSMGLGMFGTTNALAAQKKLGILKGNGDS